MDNITNLPMVSKFLASNILQLAVRSGGQILDIYLLGLTGHFPFKPLT